MLIKKLTTIISIYLVIFLYSQQAFSAGFPLEFDQEFDSKIKLLSARRGERYASALTSMNLSNKVYKMFGEVKLKEYIKNIIKRS